jgi:energy-coupling factor transport system permease protein
MSFSADIYVERDSWLHRMDPRIKVIYVALGIMTILLFKSIFVILLALLLTQLLILAARVPRDNLLWVWKRMLPINILIPLLFILFYPEGQAVLQFWFIQITPLAFVRGLALALRLDAIAFLVFSWMFTTDQTRIVRSFVKLGLPYNGGLVIAISLRYIPTFYGTYNTVAEAQQARALDLRKGSLLERLRNHLPILVAMIISALRTADKLAKALESRALGFKGAKRTCYRDIAFRSVDYIYLALILAAFLGVLYIRFGLNAGVDLLYPMAQISQQSENQVSQDAFLELGNGQALLHCVNQGLIPRTKAKHGGAGSGKVATIGGKGPRFYFHPALESCCQELLCLEQPRM